MDNSWIKKIAAYNDAEDLITLREECQYGTEIAADKEKLKELLPDAKKLIGITKEILTK